MRLFVVDIDQTLFHTESVIRVVSGGKTQHSLSSADFNSYQLRDGESFDFSDFRCGVSFATTARPIPAVHEFVQSEFMGNDVLVYLTARGMVDDLKMFMRPFRQHLLPTAPVLFSGEFHHSPVENKRVVLRNILKLSGYKKMLIVDDHAKHLDMALGLQEEFPDLLVEAHLVQQGRLTPYFHTS